jgi:2',3'-cyclic-nucleotide 2'-phosphodiesterase
VRILFIGDIVGKSGRLAVQFLLPKILKNEKIDFCIANVENAAGGVGITPDVVQELFTYGIDVMTSGNHIFDKKAVLEIISKEDRLIRPLNYPEYCPGNGYNTSIIKDKYPILIINIAGRTFMDSLDCPFDKASKLLEKFDDDFKIVIVDFHAEATSEKISMAYFLDGKVSAVIGTHTHVQTADERILPKGTGFITDVGMTGAFDSVIGMEKEEAIARFVTKMPYKFKVANNDKKLSAVILDVDTECTRTNAITRLFVSWDE